MQQPATRFEGRPKSIALTSIRLLGQRRPIPRRSDQEMTAVRLPGAILRRNFLRNVAANPVLRSRLASSTATKFSASAKKLRRVQRSVFGRLAGI